MSVDWNEPIEAYHPDGRVVAADVLDDDGGENCSIVVGLSGLEYVCDRSGEVVCSDWCIRNVPKPDPTPTKTLRDEFAMAALAGFNNPSRSPAEDARKAYQIADAMMNARKEMGDD